MHYSKSVNTSRILANEVVIVPTTCYCATAFTVKTMKKSRVHTVRMCLSGWLSQCSWMRFRDKGTAYRYQVQYNQILESVNIYIFREKLYKAYCARGLSNVPQMITKISIEPRLCHTNTQTPTHTYPWLKAWHLQIFFDHFNGWAMSIHAIFFTVPRLLLSFYEKPSMARATHCFWFLHNKIDWNWNFPFWWFYIFQLLLALLPISSCQIYFHHFSVWSFKLCSSIWKLYVIDIL